MDGKLVKMNAELCLPEIRKLKRISGITRDIHLFAKQINSLYLLRRNKHYLKENKMNLSQQVKNTSYHKELSRWISKKYLKE